MKPFFFQESWLELKRIFVDTNIFLDYYLDRKDSMLPLGEFAFKMIKEAVECKYVVLICEQIIEEICRVTNVTEEDIWNIILLDLNEAKKIEFVSHSENQLIEANNLSKINKTPLFDCLFAVLARDNKAILVSRDKHCHETLSGIAETVFPEELL